MDILFKYEPEKGITYNEIFFPWGVDRSLIRSKLFSQYIVQDLEFEGFGSRRDVYKELSGQPVLIFFNYNSNDQFSELEIHNGVNLAIYDKSLRIGQPFWEAVDKIGMLSLNSKYIDETEVLFVDLKLSVCSDLFLDGDATDEKLNYIYCSDNIDHLLS